MHVLPAKEKRRILIAIGVVGLVIAAGTLGYQFLLGWNFSDSLYMTLTTITTVGFKEVHPLEGLGRIWTLCLIFFGVGAMLYALSVVWQFILEGQLQNIFRRNRMERQTFLLTNHVIVCGYGKMGRIVVDELRRRKVPFVVMESMPEVALEAAENDCLVVEGDATHDETLRKAGVEKARAIVCVLDTDAKNLYVTLSARVLNRDIQIIGKCNEEGAGEKFIRAGASKVIYPYRIGARQMTEMILQPTVMAFLETALETSDLQLSLQELSVPRNSFLDGVTLQHSGLRQKYNVILVGVRRAGEEHVRFNPPTSQQLGAGDTLVILSSGETTGKLQSELGLG